MHTVVLVWKAVNMKTVLPIYSQRVLCFCNICKIRFVAQILEVSRERITVRGNDSDDQIQL